MIHLTQSSHDEQFPSQRELGWISFCSEKSSSRLIRKLFWSFSMCFQKGKMAKICLFIAHLKNKNRISKRKICVSHKNYPYGICWNLWEMLNPQRPLNDSSRLFVFLSFSLHSLLKYLHFRYCTMMLLIEGVVKTLMT